MNKCAGNVMHCPSAAVTTTNPIRTGLALNPGVCDDWPATNRLRHGTALCHSNLTKRNALVMQLDAKYATGHLP